MEKKYENEQAVPMFGKYSDPFGNRRGSGSRRPAQPVSADAPSFCRQFDSEKLYFAWLGHSSVFLHMQGPNILIDPVFSAVVSPVPFAGPRRFSGRAPKPADFPGIDLVLITHSHYDHLDKKTLVSLDTRVKHYAVPAGVGADLRRFGIAAEKITELAWYESFCQAQLAVTLVPSQHDSGRGPLSMNTTLWGGFVLQSRDYTVYASGDGGYAGHFSRIHEKFGDIDLTIMECGQYSPKWHAIHMFPEESVQACLDLHAKLAVPVHWGAYVLSDHPWDDPPKRFSQRAEELHQPYRVMRINEWLEIRRDKE